MSQEPRCPLCGYTAKDAAIHMDHGLCKGKIPKSQSKNPAIPQALSPGEEAFAIMWRCLRGPETIREFEFSPDRGWRFDFAWPDAKIAVEIEGGVREGLNRGRHLRAKGFERDAEKYNEAALMGWRVIRLTSKMIQPALVKRIIGEVRDATVRMQQV